MNDQPKRGRRVQVYIPADLLTRWDQLPRYERSAEVANALRAWWGIDELTPELTPRPEVTPGVIDRGSHQEAE